MFKNNIVISLPKSNPPVFEVKKDYSLQYQHENNLILKEIKNNQIELSKQVEKSNRKQFYFDLILYFFQILIQILLFLISK
jgi:hypothetical protein